MDVGSYLIQYFSNGILETVEVTTATQAKWVAIQLKIKYELPHLHCEEINIYQRIESPDTGSKVFEIQTNLILGK